MLLAHPQLVPAFLARPGLGPNAARLGEITFRSLRRGGLEGDRAVEAFRVLLIYSLPTTDRHFHTGLRWLLEGIGQAPEG